MNCLRCGKEIPKEQRKCPRCGTEIIFKTTDELLEESDILNQLEEYLEKSSSIKTFAAGEIIGGKYIVKGAREERGNFGIVYRAEDKDTNKVWALKSIYEKLLTSTEAAASLKDELAIVLSLDHPNIIKLEDYGSHEGSIYTVSEYWVGVPLHKLVEGRKDLNRPFSLSEIASYFEPVLDAMEYIHNMQLLHGNLIPSNVIVRRELDLLKETEGITPLEEVKVSDLGLFKGLYNHIPQLELINFSFREFRAPEIYARKAEFLTTRADIFSLGAILYLLIFMIPPSTEMAVEKINLDERPYPQEMVHILQKCLNPYPEERFESVTALKSAWFVLMKEADKQKKVEKPTEVGVKEAVKGETQEIIIERKVEEKAAAEAKAVMPEKEAVEEVVIETAKTKVEELLKESAKASDEMRAKEAVIARETAPSAEKKRPQAISTKSIFAIIAMAVALAAAALLGYSYFVNRPLFNNLKSKVSPPQEQVVPPTQPQPEVKSEELSVVEEVQPQPPAEEVPTAEEPLVEEQPPAVAEPPAPAVDPRITELLAKAKSALEARRITRPARDSALYYYREVLKIDKDNAEAKEGIIIVAKESTMRGDNEFAKGDLEKAEIFYRAALGAAPDYQPAIDGLNRIKERRAQPPAPTQPRVGSPPKPITPAEETVNLEELIPPKPQEKKEPERAVEKTTPSTSQQGSIDIKKVNETIQNQYMGRIRLCYATALEQNPNLAGDVVIRFTIGLEGKVIGADVASYTLPDSGAVECIRRRFLIMEFPAPSGGPVTINYRLSFKP